MRSLAARFAAAAAISASAATVELDLAGEWKLDFDGREIAAAVPGGVHDALLAAGVVGDIYYGSN